MSTTPRPSCAPPSPRGADSLLAAVGVLSAEPYAGRRNIIRDTWCRFDEVARGAVAVRFLIAVHVDVTSDATRRAADELWLPTNVSLSRITSPLTTLFRWLQHATVHFADARFVIKTDDDAYVVVPALCTLLQIVDGEHRAHPAVYIGRTYWTAFHRSQYMHAATSVNPSAVDGAQILNAFPTRKTPAYEDVWLGFALAGLLEADALAPLPPHLSYVSLSPTMAFDDYGFAMNNFTTLVHWQSGGGKSSKSHSNTLLSRMRAAHDHAQAYHCASHRPDSVTMQCDVPGRSHTKNWLDGYSKGASCVGCTRAWRMSVCSMLPRSLKACANFNSHSFGRTDLLVQMYGKESTWRPT